MNKIVAIVGMGGSGKSIASDILVEKGWEKVYFGGVTMDKLKEERLMVTPDNEKMMRERLRKELGMGAYAKILLPRIKELANINKVVLDGVYSWDELMILKKELGEGLIVVAIVVDKPIRYSRLKVREHRPFTFDEALNRDISEIENISKAGPIAYADYYILNNGNKEEYRLRLEEILNNI